ncbi:hypothetical protein FS837_002725 [Tulasnella sp. UAMH 9824]|nr:hypothetical protein FS837_002725 [Tulasnella sp. UAMH 9824]
MLTSAYAPSSSDVRIQSTLVRDTSVRVLGDVFAPSNISMTAFLGLEDSGSPSSEAHTAITIVVKSYEVRITKSGDAERREIKLQFGKELSSGDVALLGQFFRTLPRAPPITLEIDIAAPMEESEAVDLSPWSRSLCSLSVHELEFCRSALRQLAERTEDSTTGKLAWLCPNLTSLELCYMHPGENEELDGAALESLVNARWPGKAGGQLSKFAIYCKEEQYPRNPWQSLPPLSSLPDNVEALKLARSYFNTQLDTLISCLQRHRNQAAPIHKLPTGVLVTIFAAYNKPTSLAVSPSLLDLTAVNKLWYDIIVNSPQLSTFLESDISPKIAKLVLQRSKNLPLSLIWNNSDRNAKEEEELAELLELILQHSQRLKSINVTIGWDWDNLTVPRLLQANLPRLERLQVNGVWYSYSVEVEALKFELSNGPSLREITLDTVFLTSWNSPRLTGLSALDLTSPRQAPSVEKLLNILSNSPRLERLRLFKLDYNGSAGNRPPNGTISLPSLKEIYLENSDGPYLSAILTSVYAPSSKIVRIGGRLKDDNSAAVCEEVFSQGNNQLAALLGLEDSGPSPPEVPVPFTVVVDSQVLRIAKSGDGEEREMVLRFSGRLSPRVVDLLGRFFLTLSQSPAVDLKIGPAYLIWGNAVLDLLPWSRSLHRLSVHGSKACRQALKQLIEGTEDSITGAGTWMYLSQMGLLLKLLSEHVGWKEE